MKPLLPALAFVFVTAFACAEDALMEGGRSPNGSHEVRVVHTSKSESSDYAIRIQSARTGKSFFTLDGIGGLLSYRVALERCRALWHSSGDFVVITDQDTRHSSEIYIIAIAEGRAARLALPDYVQNALGRVNATEVDLHCISTPIRWEGDDLLLSLYFSVDAPGQGRLFYTCDCTLALVHGPQTSPSVGLKSVSPPKQ